MKKAFVILVFLSVALLEAQSNVSDIFAAGLEDARRFTEDYLAPVSEASVYNLAGGWYNTAEVRAPGGFEISVIGNMTPFKEDKKTFELNTTAYENLQFVDGSVSREVSTALGELEGIEVFVEAEIAPGFTSREEFELPGGLASENINVIPSAYVQAGVGIFKGTELKARFLPRINTDDVSLGLWGFAIQHEFTDHLPADRMLPVAISGVIGYTHLGGTYDFTDTELISGEDQRIDVTINTWIFQAVLSTRLPVINFYGGLGYLSGRSDTDILGTYIVQSGPFQETYTDPLNLSEKVNGLAANLGAKLSLGFFGLHATYAFGEFDNLSLGLNFGFR